MKLALGDGAAEVIRQLNTAGFAAYAVGGCVRDMLMGAVPSDVDIATMARPEQVCALFPKTFATGLKHGTVTVRCMGEHYEVTTFRKDGAYDDSRHPNEVTFVQSIGEDLARRDFTMNAIAYHPEEGLIDPFGGQADIQDGIIRAVGEPVQRFSEDALRMLRAARFAAQLGFRVEAETEAAMCRMAGNIRYISAERVREELQKLLLSDRPQTVELLQKTGLLQYRIPELSACFGVAQNNPYHVHDLITHILEVVRQVPKEPTLRWAALFHDLGKARTRTTDLAGVDHFRGHEAVSEQIAASIMKRLKFSNQTMADVCLLVRYHDRDVLPQKKAIKRLLADVGEPLFFDLLKIKEADARAQNPKYLAPRLAEWAEAERIAQGIMKDKEPFSLKNLAVSGTDMMNLGFQGKAIGQMLRMAVEFVIEHPDQNNKQAILDYIRTDFASR